VKVDESNADHTASTPEVESAARAIATPVRR
jgi:hypothetical protein